MDQKTVSALWWLVSLLPFRKFSTYFTIFLFLGHNMLIVPNYLSVFGGRHVSGVWTIQYSSPRAAGGWLQVGAVFTRVLVCAHAHTPHTAVKGHEPHQLEMRCVCMCVCSISYIFLRDISTLQEFLTREWQYNSSRHMWKRNTGIKDLVCSPKSII